jgi:hypothetical protein
MGIFLVGALAALAKLRPAGIRWRPAAVVGAVVAPPPGAAHAANSIPAAVRARKRGARLAPAVRNRSRVGCIGSPFERGRSASQDRAST